MTRLHLVWRNLVRKKVRTTFTLLSVVVAFVLFAYLGAIQIAFSLGIDVTGQDRLLTIHKVSLIQPLPLSYEGRIEATDGVLAAAHATWFGGKYQDEYEGRFGIFPIEPEDYMPLYPEMVVPPDQWEAFVRTRTGALVGRKTADDFGFEVGDRVPIQGTIFHRADGSSQWEFDVAAIYDGDRPGVDETMFFVHWDYFNEARDQGQDTVGWYAVKVADPDDAASVARRIDEKFANSPYETETSTEKAFLQGFANQIGNIGAILRWVLTAVFFTILLVTGNTMAQSVRERTSELAVLKTLGFRDGTVLVMVLVESLVLALAGAVVGLGVGWALVGLGDPTDGGLPLFFVPPEHLLLGVALAVGLGLLTGVLPAIQAMRLRIVDALRRA